MKPSYRMAALAAMLAVLLGWWMMGHHAGESSGGKHHGNKNAPVPVAIATAKSGDIPVYLEGLGSVTPRSVVTVHSQINGELTQVLFREGQMVEKGDLLATIDDRPYVAQLEQAEGLLGRDQALLSEAKLNLARYQTLWKQNSIARQQVDTQVSLVKQYEGSVANDQGQVDNAKANLAYTKIAAPVSGRVGLRQVDAGNVVHTTDSNGIVVVTELQPITALFTIPEDNIPDILRQTGGGDHLVAEAWDRANKTKLATGTLTAIDNQVDPATGTVKFRAEFANEDHALFPSQFVNIHLKLDTLKEVVTMPVSAVQRGTHGTFVYLVKPDNTVAVQDVTLGPASGEMVAVDKGIKVDDEIVVDGADALRDGAKIDIAMKDGVASEAKDTKESGHHKHGKNGENGKDKTP